MHVGAAVEPPNLRQIPTLVVIIADVTGLMKILDTMEQEPRREPTLLDRLGFVADHLAEFVDLVHDAPLRRDVTAKFLSYLGSSNGTST